MSLTFSLDDISDENPYNASFNEYYADDSPGLNFNHKLRDFEEFTTARQHFETFGVYTKYPVNRHGHSKFIQFWKEEKRRCLEGYNIGRDWIPGYYYFYLNYTQIEKVVYTKDKLKAIRQGKKVKARRIEAFPDVWDYDYYWFHYLEEAENGSEQAIAFGFTDKIIEGGQHASQLKSRGKGASYKGASMLNRNFFLIPNSKSYVIAHESGYLEGGDGILARAYNHKQFINNNTAWWKHSHEKNKVMHYKASKIIKNPLGQELKLGYKSEVIGISLKGDVGRARGKRGKLILWEESGNFPGLTEAWKIAIESIEQDAAVYGLMVAFGTSGSEQKSFTNLKNMFLKPDAYNIKSIPNVWSEKVRNSKVGFFFPAWANINGFMDKDGNTDTWKANKIEISKLETLRLNRADPNVVIQHKMERPRRPEDALQKKGYNAFPVRELRDRLADLETNTTLFNSRYVGRMKVREGKAVFEEDPNVIPIDSFPHDVNDDNTGAIVIWDKPIIRGGIPISNLYIAGGDPYDHDKSTTMSLGSTFILNRATGQLVAEYTGRPDRAEENWEQTRLLLLYYNARINHENALIGFRNYLERKGSEFLMVETPEVIQSLHKHSKNVRPYGTPATPKINIHARTRIAEWLKSKTGADNETTYAQSLESVPLIQELIDWDPDGNYDRISALGMLMILYEDVMALDTPRGGSKEEKSVDTDPIWNKMMQDVDSV